ncbi:MAG: hypothetical protein AAF682_11030 [Planctomycetota bacterium]
MIERAGALDVYFEEEIEILVADPETFSVAAVEEVLTESEVAFSMLAPVSGM